jgi:hypothetical protein
MKVWVCILQEGWDGYGDPAAVFSSYAAAHKYIEDNAPAPYRGDPTYDRWHVFELELDHPTD